MLPFPYVDDCLKEIAYAFDTLKVDGIGCMTSYGDKWLGYAEFEPVWEELNRRKATVYTHPTTANCCVNLVRGIDDAYIEFGTDTTRSIFSLIFSGSSQKNKDINWIWSHGGGALTAFADRFLVQAISRPPYAGKVTRAIVDGELKRFYYDTAQVANNVTLAAMAQRWTFFERCCPTHCGPAPALVAASVWVCEQKNQFPAAGIKSDLKYFRGSLFSCPNRYLLKVILLSQRLPPSL